MHGICSAYCVTMATNEQWTVTVEYRTALRKSHGKQKRASAIEIFTGMEPWKDGGYRASDAIRKRAKY